MGHSTQYYKDNPDAAKKKAKKDKEINARPEQKAKRRELAKKRYDDEKKGKDIKGKDYDHAVKKYVKPSTNRGRKGEGNR